MDLSSRRSRRPRTTTVLSVSIGILLVLMVWFCVLDGRDEPVHRGKRLSVWLQTYEPSSSSEGPSSPKWRETDDAVRHLGTNCIPVLLRMIREKDSKLKVQFEAFARKSGLFKRRFVPASEKNVAASRAFIVLGATAKEAVPELVRISDQNISIESRCAIEDAFSWIGPEARPALPLLLRSSRDSNPRIRANALWALGEIHTQPELCVPVLIRSLNDTNGWVTLSAAHALGRFGPDARSAVPALTDLTRQRGWSSPFVTDMLEARNALRKINAPVTSPLDEMFPEPAPLTADTPALKPPVRPRE